MRKLILLTVVGIWSVAAAQAQQIDAAFGVSTLEAPSALDASQNYSQQSIRGGTYVGFSGDALLKRSFGFGAEVNWRTSQNLYGGYQPFRPIFYDFNGVWAPSISKFADAELQAGIGAQSVRFYQNSYTCSYFGGCTNYTSENRFMGHFGGGVRFYVHKNIFVRPEAHIYLVNNNVSFSSFHSERYGVSIGYSFGKRDKDRYGY